MNQKKEVPNTPTLPEILNEVKVKVSLLEPYTTDEKTDVNTLKLLVNKKVEESKGKFAKIRKKLKKRKSKLKKSRSTYTENSSSENAEARVKEAEKYAQICIEMLGIAHEKAEIALADLAIATAESKALQVASNQ